ncbi:hypothetical protein ACHAW6_008863 [Cyclotella cf. meneghiniana]
MEHPKYMRLKVADIPNDFIALYKLNQLTTADGYIYVLIQKRNVQSSTSRNNHTALLKQCFSKKGYRQSTLTPGFWKHDWRPISFTLCVDDFGVEYVGIKHAHHLIKTLNKHNQMSQDWKGEQYLGLTIKWDYPQQQVHLSMPGYCQKAGHFFRHPASTKQQHQPYPHMACTYSAKQQYTQSKDNSPLLNKADKPFIQACAVNCTMLTALGSIATQQAAPT